MVAWAAILPAVKAIAPTVGKMVGSKIGGDLLGKVTPKLGSALGGIGGLFGGDSGGSNGNNSFTPQVFGGQVQSQQMPTNNMYSLIAGQGQQGRNKPLNLYDRLVN